MPVLVVNAGFAALRIGSAVPCASMISLVSRTGSG